MRERNWKARTHGEKHVFTVVVQKHEQFFLNSWGEFSSYCAKKAPFKMFFSGHFLQTILWLSFPRLGHILTKSSKPYLSCITLPLKFRIKYSISLLVYKALNGQALSYDMELIVLYFQTRTLRSQGARLLVVPRVSKSRTGGRTFSSTFLCSLTVYRFSCLWSCRVRMYNCTSAAQHPLLQFLLLIIFPLFVITC